MRHNYMTINKRPVQRNYRRTGDRSRFTLESKLTSDSVEMGEAATDCRMMRTSPSSFSEPMRAQVKCEGSKNRGTAKRFPADWTVLAVVKNVVYKVQA